MQILDRQIVRVGQYQKLYTFSFLYLSNVWLNRYPEVCPQTVSWSENPLPPSFCSSRGGGGGWLPSFLPSCDPHTAFEWTELSNTGRNYINKLINNRY